MLFDSTKRACYYCAFCVIAIFSSGKTYAQPLLQQAVLAKKYYGNDAPWFVTNTTFFECSDKQIEQVYYYRWKMYKVHIRHTGPNEYVITEFINHVAWDSEPYCTINAASMHHINEGRWLKDDRFMNGYINYLYQQGGNNRSYSESIADAAYARHLVNMDRGFIIHQQWSMAGGFYSEGDARKATRKNEQYTLHNTHHQFKDSLTFYTSA